MVAHVVSHLALSLIEVGLNHHTAAGVGQAFLGSLRPFGATAIFSRATTAGGATVILSRISPPGWEDLYSSKRFAASNFVNRVLPSRDKVFAWSDVTLVNRAEERLAAAGRDFGANDGLAIPFHTAEGVGVTSLAFERMHQISPDERQSIEMAGLVLHERMRRLEGPQGGTITILTPRERDCVGLMTQGKKDAEIADQLQISLGTVLTHMNSAKRKLNARTRAHAAAIALIQGLL